MMSAGTLSNFGTDAIPEIRRPVRAQAGDKGCPRCSLRFSDMAAGETGAVQDLPVEALVFLTDACKRRGVESLRTHGWRCTAHRQDILLPSTVCTIEAKGFHEELIGVPVSFDAGDPIQRVPVRLDDYPAPIAAHFRTVMDR